MSFRSYVGYQLVGWAIATVIAGILAESITAAGVPEPWNIYCAVALGYGLGMTGLLIGAEVYLARHRR